MTALFPIPDSWAWTTLGEIAEVVGGVTKDTKKQSDPALQMVPYLRVANVQRGYLDLREITKIRVPEATLSKLRLLSGDVLLNEGGDRDKLGRGWVWEGQIPNCIHQNHVFRARLPEGTVLPKFLALYINDPARQWFDQHATQSVNLASISLSMIKQLPVPLPPLDEQIRIVASLEEHLSHLEVGVAALHSTDLRLRQWLAGFLASSTRSTENEQSLPTDWQILHIKDMARVGSGATPLRSRQDYYKDGTVPWITSSLLNNPFICKPEQYITEKAVAETAVKLWPIGTLLVAMYGEGKTRGHCSELKIAATTNQACAAIVMFTEFKERQPWIKLVLESSYEVTRSLASGGVQPNLSLGLIKDLRIPLPPHSEQERIIAEVEHMRYAREIAQRELKHAERKAQILRRNLLSFAFAGQLVPQDPADEPASMLLERIRAARVTQPQVRRGRRTAKQIAQEETLL